MKVLIYEPDPGGHRFTAVRMLLDSLATINSAERLQISLATTHAALDTEEYALQLAPVADQFEHLPVPAFTRGAGPLKIAHQKVRFLAALFTHTPFDHLYIPYADGMAQMLGIMRLNPFFRWPRDLVIEALLMRGGFAYPGASKAGIAANLRSIALAGCGRIHWIDPLPAGYVERHAPKLNTVCNLMPDPTPYLPAVDRLPARQALQLPLDGRIAGCVGRIDERKGMDKLITAFANARLEPTDRLLLAGRQTDRIRQLLASLPEPSVKDRIISIDRYLDNDELLFATSAIDLMVTPYPDFVGSVSIVARAAMAGRMSLGANTGWMGHVIPRFELGAVCDVNDPAALVDRLPEALASSEAWSPTPAAQVFLDFMSRENVLAHWSALLRERLGVSAPVAPREWPADNIR